MAYEDQALPPFDPKALCVKCGWSIPDPVAPVPKMIKGPDGKSVPGPAEPPPPPEPPTVEYCNGLECPWAEETEGVDVVDEHMHQFCDTCGYEWLAKPLG